VRPSLRAAVRPWCLLSFSLLLVRSRTYRRSHKYRHGASCVTWLNDFSLQPQSEFFMNIWGWLLEIYLWGDPLSPVTLSPPWYAFW
jgi:hypothetical protein